MNDDFAHSIERAGGVCNCVLASRLKSTPLPRLRKGESKHFAMWRDYSPRVRNSGWFSRTLLNTRSQNKDSFTLGTNLFNERTRRMLLIKRRTEMHDNNSFHQNCEHFHPSFSPAAYSPMKVKPHSPSTLVPSQQAVCGCVGLASYLRLLLRDRYSIRRSFFVPASKLLIVNPRMHPAPNFVTRKLPLVCSLAPFAVLYRFRRSWGLLDCSHVVVGASH